MHSGTPGTEKLFLLPTYVLFETSRAVLTFAAIVSGVRISSTYISFCSEAFKAAFAIIFLLRYISREYGSVSIRNFFSAINSITSVGIARKPWRAYAAFAIPALLYLVNNILYLLGLQLTTPALLHVTILAKLPITALLHHFLIRRQRNSRAWLSLGVLCVGLLVTYIPSEWSSWIWQGQVGETDDIDASPTVLHTFVGSFIGLAIAIISGFTSTYTEIVLKQEVPFWVAQFWLYLFGTIFGAMAYYLWDGMADKPRLELAQSSLVAEPNPFENIVTNISIIIFTAATGLVVANILRKKDNLVKLVGTSASIVTILATQCLLFSDLRKNTLTVEMIIGTGIITLSTWTYHYYKHQQPIPQYSAINSEASSDSESTQFSTIYPEKHSRGEVTPTPKRITALVAFVAILALLTGLQIPQRSSTGSENDGTFELPEPEWDAAFDVPYPSLLDMKPVGVDDVERYFIPHNITPAVWGQVDTPYTCISDWIDREQIYPVSTKFVDWENTFIKSNCPIYSIPRGGMLFHQYWSGKWRPFNEVSIEAWLATQRLGDGHRLIYWYDNGEPPKSVLGRFTTSEYAKFIEFRRLDRTKEAEGTCVADMPEYNSEEYRRANNMRLEALSDITRNLLLAKYGGVWLDSDTIPMRDLTPLIRSGPSAGGIDLKDWNNNVLVFGPPNTTVTQRILTTTCSLTTNRTLYHERYGLDAIIPREWHWMWNDALFKTCAYKNHCGVGRLPIYFNDGYAWTGKGQRAMKPCERNQQWYGSLKPLPTTLRTLWTWHARLGQYDDSCVDKTGKTVVAAVRRRIDQLLSYGLDMNGRDLFPGPALTT